jgi:hypothetical protein
MDQFFFHLSSADELICDTKGREFSDLAAAHRHAIKLINKMVLLHELDWQGWCVKVSDANGQPVLSVLFPQSPYFRFNHERGLNNLMVD